MNARLLAAAIVLAEFAKTAPGRLPFRVESAIAAITEAALSTAGAQRRASEQDETTSVKEPK